MYTHARTHKTVVQAKVRVEQKKRGFVPGFAILSLSFSPSAKSDRNFRFTAGLLLFPLSFSLSNYLRAGRRRIHINAGLKIALIAPPGLGMSFFLTSLNFFVRISRETQYEQDLDFTQTQRQLNYRRRKEEVKKKLHRLKKLQKLRQDAERKGEGHDKVRRGGSYMCTQ